MSDAPTVTLPDARQLAYESCGRTDGRPVLCFHGNPGSRLLWSLLDDVAQDRDVHLIAPDRPGFGLSDFQRGRTLLDWPEDVAALADQLGLEQFGVVGFAAGGPHAAACAYALPERVTGAALVSSVAPPSIHEYAGGYEQHLYTASRSVPGVSRGLFRAAGWVARHWRPRLRKTMKHSLSASDRALFEGPEGDVIVADAAEAFQSGSRGPAHEFTMLGDAWGFDPGDVAAPMALWHGNDDALVDASMSRSFAAAAPDAECTVVDGGHYSTLFDNAADVVAATNAT